jgi:hypothetical protein
MGALLVVSLGTMTGEKGKDTYSTSVPITNQSVGMIRAPPIPKSHWVGAVNSAQNRYETQSGEVCSRLGWPMNNFKVGLSSI